MGADELQGLRDLIESRFDSTDLRIGDLRNEHLRMHAENSHRLDLINGKVNKAHERVSTLEGVVQGMQALIQHVRDRVHDVARKAQSVSGDGTVTLSNLKWYLLIAGTSIGFTWWFVTAVLKYHP